MGAGPDNPDVGPLHAEAVQQPGVGPPQVQKILAGVAWGGPGNVLRKTGGLEGPFHLRTDIVTGGTDARAKRRDEVGGVRPEGPLHLPNGALQDPDPGPTPAAMDRGDGSIFLVHEKDGKAVGGPDNEKEPRHIRDQGVAAQTGRGRSLHPVDGIRMELAHDDSPKLLEALGPGEIVLPPVPGSEPVDEPGDSLQARDRKIGFPGFRHEPMYYQKSPGKKRTLAEPQSWKGEGEADFPLQARLALRQMKEV